MSTTKLSDTDRRLLGLLRGGPLRGRRLKQRFDEEYPSWLARKFPVLEPFCGLGYATMYLAMSRLCANGFAVASDETEILDGTSLKLRSFELTELGRHATAELEP